LRHALEDRDVYPLGPARTLVVLAGTYLASFVASFNQTVTATALPRIVHDLGGLGHYSWVVTSYLLASIVTIPLFGRLSDIHGRRALFVVAIAVFSAGSILASAAPSLPVLLAGRVVQGLGAGGLGPLALAVLGDIIAPRERGKWQAVTGTVLAVSAVGGPLVGGWLTDHASWRLAFLATLPLAAAALVVIWLGFGNFGERHRRSIDYPGAVLLTIGSGAALLAVSTGRLDRLPSSPGTLGLLAASIAILGAFVAWERRAPDPILPLSLLRRRPTANAAVGLFAVGGAMLGAVTYVPLFVQDVLGRDATSAGAVLIPLTLSWFGASIVAGQIVSRTGRSRPVLLLGAPLAGLGFLLLARLGRDASIGAAARDVAIIGAGFGLMAQTFVVVVQDAAPRAELGAATASAEFSRWVGALTGVAAMGAIVTAHVGRGATHSAPPAVLAVALHTAFAMGVGLAGLAFAAALLLPDTELRASIRPSTAPPASGT
jgi:EmrB/QacA subfamily drug resistance transporter